MGSGFFIPPLIDPNELTCVKFLMPNDPLYRQVVRGHLYHLGHGYFWGDSDSEVANDVGQLFLVNLLDSLEIGADCDGEDSEGGLGQCFRMDTTTDVFSFYPNDPFTDGANVQGNKILSSLKWIRWGDADLFNMPIIGDVAENLVNAVVQYFPNDIIVALDFIEILNPIARFQDLIEQVTNFPLPYVRIELEGTGQVEIEVLNMPFGGVVMIVPDLPVDENLIPDIQGTIDTLIGFFDDGLDLPKGWVSLFLDRDITKLDLVPTQIQEFEFEEGGTHTLHAFFCPILTPDPPFINPFGGIREIEFCGNITVLGATTGNLIDIKNYGLEQHRREGIIMTTKEEICEGVICALETVAGRIVSGQSGNIKNNVIIDSIAGAIEVSDSLSGGHSGGGTAPDVNASQDEILYGGAMGVGRGFRDLVGDIILRKITQNRTAQNVADLLRGFFYFRGLVDGVDMLASAFGTPLDNANDVVNPVVNAESIANIVYCNGASKQSLYRYALQVEDANGSDATDIANWYRLLIDELENEQIEEWYQTGLSIPDTGYRTTSCYRIDNTVVDYDESEYVYFNTVDVLLPRIWRLEITGKAVNGGGTEFDGHYMANGQLGMFFQASNGTVVSPVGVQKSDNGYTFTLEHTGTGLATFDRMSFGGALVNYHANTPFQSNNLQFTLIDLGGA